MFRERHETESGAKKPDASMLISSQFPRALIMAHYDPQGIVDPHVQFALQAYRKAFSHITFVSTGVLHLASCMSALVDTFIPRDNVGFDFFSWKIGFNALSGKERFFEIIFANDSVYGPFFDVEHCLLAPNVKDADLWGMTASSQYRWHIQSFFFAMRNRMVVSADAQAFWDEVVPFANKVDVIQRYELNMADYFAKRGWSAKAIFDSLTTRNGLRTPARSMIDLMQPGRSLRYLWDYSFLRDVNPMHHRWYDVLQSGVPFTKVELLRSNPKQIPLKPVRGYLDRQTRYPMSMIASHISRTSDAV
jgi:rhamnosyltransferase